MTKRISNFLKIATIICAVAGIILCSINARYDGYSHWSKRLLFFTNQSNVWIVIVMILMLLPFNAQKRQSIILTKYIFTISITITGLIFCCFLAPFADESYHSWSLSGILTHIAVPVFSIADFFIDKEKIKINKKGVFLSLIPPLCYFALCSLLFLFNVDFGRGENFPYFFLNFASPAGFFGFSNQPPYIVGSFYWIIFLLSLILIISMVYAKLNNIMFNRLNNNKTK